MRFVGDDWPEDRHEVEVEVEVEVSSRLAPDRS
jgi:hypothetical protein